MLQRLILACCYLMVAACGRASAQDADSSNPAHCYAAMNFAKWTFEQGRPRRDMADQMLARAAFEMWKVTSSGGSLKSAQAEAVELTRRKGAALKDWDALLSRCLSAQDSDPRLRALMPFLVSASRQQTN